MATTPTSPSIPGTRVVQVRHDDVAPDHAGDHHFLQVSTLDALVEKRFDGDLTIGELLEHGDHGIGTLNGLDGELLVIDGTAFQMTVEGKAHAVPAQRKTPFALVTWFAADARRELAGAATRAQVESAVAQLVDRDRADDPDAPLAVRISGTFDSVTARSAVPEQQPYRDFADAVAANQRKFTLDGFTGTMFGYRFPDAAAGIQIPGFHLHAIDEARTIGGHVLDYTAQDVTVEIQHAKVLQIELPPGAHPDHLGLSVTDLDAVHAVEG